MRIAGARGDDTLSGDGGNDDLFAGRGDDTLEAENKTLNKP